MNTIKIISISILLIASTSLIAMEQGHSVSQRHSIAHLSSGSASCLLIERLTYVKDLMVERNLLDKDIPVSLGYLSEQALNDMEKDGCSTLYNALTNGIDSI